MLKELFSFAERIRTLREGAGQTQAELARILGITRSSVNAWEMGLTVPSTQYIVALSKLYQVSSDFLLGLDDSASISVEGLSDAQIKAVLAVVDCLREKKTDNTTND